MFEELKDKHKDYIFNLEEAYAESNKLGLSPTVLKYRKLDGEDFSKLFQIVDELQAQIGYDHLSGACLLVHSNLQFEFDKHGYKSELILGDAIVNGVSYMECDLEELTNQLNEGVKHATQKIHSWLLLENGQFFDATIIRDLTDGKYAAELYCYGLHTDSAGNVIEYKPVLAGAEFVTKTSPIVVNF